MKLSNFFFLMLSFVMLIFTLEGECLAYGKVCDEVAKQSCELHCKDRGGPLECDNQETTYSEWFQQCSCKDQASNNTNINDNSTESPSIISDD